MYLRRTERRTKDGTVGYLQLAHNEWDPVRRPGKQARPSPGGGRGDRDLNGRDDLRMTDEQAEQGPGAVQLRPRGSA
jgi:hypothetical protein